MCHLAQLNILFVSAILIHVLSKMYPSLVLYNITLKISNDPEDSYIASGLLILNSIYGHGISPNQGTCYYNNIEWWPRVFEVGVGICIYLMRYIFINNTVANWLGTVNVLQSTMMRVEHLAWEMYLHLSLSILFIT